MAEPVAVLMVIDVEEMRSRDQHLRLQRQPLLRHRLVVVAAAFQEGESAELVAEGRGVGQPGDTLRGWLPTSRRVGG